MPRLYRREKISSLIEHELSALFDRKIEIPGALVTITNVSVSEDFLETNVSISIIPYEKELEVYSEVQKLRKKFEHEVLKKTKLRSIPKFKFVIDSHKM